MAFTTSQATVSELFQSSFGRAVSSLTALDAWVARFDAKPSATAEQDILAEMNLSAESATIYGSKTDTEAVDFIFSNSLGRVAEEPGRQAWIDRAATIDLDQLQQEILVAARGNADSTYLDGQVAIAEAALASDNPGTGSTFTLTNSTDVATANIFNADMVWNDAGSDRILSLQDEDVLTGEAGATDNTLNAVLGQVNANEGDQAVRTPELKNIQILNLDVTGTANVFDARFSDALEEINVNKITSTAGNSTVQNILTPASVLSVSNTLNNASNSIFDYVRGVLDGTVATGDANTLELSLDRVLANGVSVSAGGGAAVGVSVLNEGFEHVNLAVSNGVDLRGTLFVEDMEDLTITGTGSLDVLSQVWTTSEYNLFAAALGNGGSIGQRTIDASAFAGDLNLDVTLGMGAKVDPDNSGALFHTAITGGSGDDAFHTAAGMASSANGTQDGIDGGAGDNTLVSYNGGITGGNGTTTGPAVNTNIQTLELREQGGVGVVDIDAFDSSLASVYMRDEDAGATTFTLNDLTVDLAASGMTLAHNIAAGGAQTVIANLKVATGADDTMALTVVDSESLTPGVFNYTFAAGGTDTDGILGTVNTGVAATSDADAIENVIIHDNDSESNTVTLTNIINHTKSVVLDGGVATQSYTVTGTLNAASVDASAQLSDLRLTVGDTVGAITTITQDVKLGAGNDVLTFANVDELDATDSLTDAGGNDTVRAAFSQNSTLDIDGIENLHVTATANVTLGMANADVTNLVLLSNTAVDNTAGAADLDVNGVQEPFGFASSAVGSVITLDSSTLTELNYFADADNDDAVIVGADDVVAHTFNGVTLANNSASDIAVNINTSLDIVNTGAASGAATYALGQITTHGNTGMNIVVGNEQANNATVTTINNIYAKTMSTLTASATGAINFGTISGAATLNSLNVFDMSAVAGVVTANILSLGDNAVVTLAGANNNVNALGSAGKDVVMTAGNGNNTLTGTGQDDTITTGSGWDTINADRGDNVVSAGAGNDTVTAKDGNDTVTFSGGANVYQDNFATVLDATLATNTVSLAGSGVSVQIDTNGVGGVAGLEVNQVVMVGAGSDLTVSWLGATLNAAAAVLDGALASVDVMVSTAGSDLVIATAIGGDVFTGGAGNDVYITSVATGSFLTFSGGAGNDAAVGSDGTDLFVGGTGADLYAMQNSTTVLDLDADVVTIADGDSLTSAWDVISGFDVTGVARATPVAAAVAGTNVGDDKLNLADATIAAAVAAVDGTNAGTALSHTILANGVIAFDTTDAFAGATMVGTAAGQISLADAIAYVTANITVAGTVMFNYDANGSAGLTAADSTFVFQNGANDTLVELIGTYAGLEAAGAVGTFIEIA